MKPIGRQGQATVEALFAFPVVILFVGCAFALLTLTTTWVLGHHAAEESLLCRTHRHDHECAEELREFFERTRLRKLNPEVKWTRSHDRLGTDIRFTGPLALKLRIHRELRSHLTDN